MKTSDLHWKQISAWSFILVRKIALQKSISPLTIVHKCFLLHHLSWYDINYSYLKDYAWLRYHREHFLLANVTNRSVHHRAADLWSI